MATGRPPATGRRLRTASPRRERHRPAPVGQLGAPRRRTDEAPGSAAWPADACSVRLIAPEAFLRRACTPLVVGGSAAGLHAVPQHASPWPQPPFRRTRSTPAGRDPGHTGRRARLRGRHVRGRAVTGTG